MKIIYGCSNRAGSQLQLNSLIPTLRKHNYISFGYSKYNDTVDYYSDNIIDKKDYLSPKITSQKIVKYFKLIEKISPDLIISDLDPVISFAAINLNIPLWQVSPLLLYFSIPYKLYLSLSSQPSFLYIKEMMLLKNYKLIIENSNKLFVYSIFGEIESPIELANGFEYIRPTFNISSRISEIENNFIIYLNDKDQKLYSLKNEGFYYNKYDNTYLKNLEKSQFYIHQAYTNNLADAFFNRKTSIISQNIYEPESVINYVLSKHSNIGISILDQFKELDINININSKIKFFSDIL